jgi:hypothetical protein
MKNLLKKSLSVSPVRFLYKNGPEANNANPEFQEPPKPSSPPQNPRANAEDGAGQIKGRLNNSNHSEKAGQRAVAAEVGGACFDSKQEENNFTAQAEKALEECGAVGRNSDKAPETQERMEVAPEKSVSDEIIGELVVSHGETIYEVLQQKLDEKESPIAKAFQDYIQEKYPEGLSSEADPASLEAARKDFLGVYDNEFVQHYMRDKLLSDTEGSPLLSQELFDRPVESLNSEEKEQLEQAKQYLKDLGGEDIEGAIEDYFQQVGQLQGEIKSGLQSGDLDLENLEESYAKKSGVKRETFWEILARLIGNAQGSPGYDTYVGSDAGKNYLSKGPKPSGDSREFEGGSSKAYENLVKTGAFGIYSSGMGGKENGDSRAPNRTGLVGIREVTVRGALALQKAVGVPMIITGGTEDGHAAGPYSHSAGYKLDIRTHDAGGQALIAFLGNIGSNQVVHKNIEGVDMKFLRHSSPHDHIDIRFTPGQNYAKESGNENQDNKVS